MSPLRILILSDGRPGHYNLSEGVAAALERLGPAETTRYEISRGKWSGLALAAMTRSKLPARRMLELVYGKDIDDLPPSDVVVSAGAETLAANVWLSRHRGATNLYYGSLRAFSPYDFSLVLTSYPERASRPRHAFAIKPSRLVPDTVPPRVVPHNDSAWPRTIALLIGGDTSGVAYSPEDWKAILDLLKRTAARRWLVANSRRTPPHVSEMLAALASSPSSPIEAFLDVRTAGPGTLTGLLARADAIVCTADSSSMISESVWSRRPTLSISPNKFTLDRHERSYRDWLISRQLCLEREITELGPGTLTQALASITPLRTNPLADLADLLMHELPALDRAQSIPESPTNS